MIPWFAEGKMDALIVVLCELFEECYRIGDGCSTTSGLDIKEKGTALNFDAITVGVFRLGFEV